MPRPLPPSVLALLGSQHGVATSRQLSSAGLSEQRLRTASRKGVLVRLHHAAYALALIWADADPAVRHCMRLQAVQLAATDAVSWGPTAAIAWNVPVRAVPALPIVWRTPASGAVAGATVKRFSYAAVSPCINAGLLVPSMPAAVVEVAAASDFADALITVDAALRRGVPLSDLHELSIVRPVNLGRERALRAVEWGDPGSESWLESLSRGRMIERQMPVPLCNVVLRRGRRIARVDNLWPELGVVGEADGKGKYGGKGKYDKEATPSEVIWREKRRHEWIEEIGFEVARWGTAEVADDGAAMEARFRRSVLLQGGVGFSWPDGVLAELPLIDGVTPPPRVVGEVLRLRALGYPIAFVDGWGNRVEPQTLIA